MRYCSFLATVLAVSAAATCSLANDVELNGQVFTLPDGFEIELAAGPPLVDRPITCDFDEQGRLYVSDSSGTNDKVDKQLEDRPHQILRLEDTDGDGRFDRRTVFADGMMFPEGTMWYAGSLYVSAAPSIWKLTDTDGDGVADQREEWFQGKTLTGCANDLHGPYLGRDGWIYWCKGGFAEQRYERPGKPPFVTRAAHIFRCRPDGSGLEHVMTGGMDNPVDVVFTSGGERIFTTTFLQHPGGGRRDGLIHAVYGGVYGKVHEVIESHPRTGDVLPPLTHLGPAAPCGLASYESQVFGPEFQGNLFACLFNLHKVTRHVLAPSGATFTTQDSDFVVSSSLDFHPTDIQEDADGSLLVVNTGGWYKLCCPTSQLWKPDVLGGIYRVRRTGVAPVADPRGRRIPWQRLSAVDLAELLADSRPAVRRQATERLVERGEAAVHALDASHLSVESPRARCQAVWALWRIDRPDARASVRQALSDSDATVRQAAVHSASVWRDHAALPRLLQLLDDHSDQVKRAAAEAIGRLGDASAVPALLAAASSGHDRFLEHSLTFALIEIADPKATAAGLSSENPRCLRAAMLALDQMPGGGLTPDFVAQRLGSIDPLIKETAAWIAERHPDWGDVLNGYLAARLKSHNFSDEQRAELTRQLARFARAASVQELLAARAEDASASPASREIALSAMAQAGLKEAPTRWLAALAQVLAGGDSEILPAAVSAARVLQLPKENTAELAAALLQVGRQPEASPAVRLEALAAVPGGLAEVDPALFDFLRSALDPSGDVSQRALAADVLGHSRLGRSQLTDLTGSLADTGPLEADRLLAGYKECEDEQVGLALVGALVASPVHSGLRFDTLRLALAKFPATVQEQARPLYAAMNVDPDRQRQRIEGLLAAFKEGDVRRGQAVFQSAKAACSACHQMGYVGGNVGPDLTRIGQVRNERDLLESIVFPSASFVRSFEPTLILTRDGRIVNGLVKSDLGDQLLLATGPREEVRIAKDDIDEMHLGRISVMPSGLDQQLSTQDLADLLAFLKAAR